MMTVWIALALAAGGQQPTTDEAQLPKMQAAMQAIQGGHPQDAVTIIDPVIAAYAAEVGKEKRHVYCGMSMPEAILYMALPDPEKRGSVALSAGYCNALYIRGFALIDLGRVAEARAMYQRALALAPMHAHFLNELGQSYRYEKNWPAMLDSCKRGESAADFAGDDLKQRERLLAWHCQGYALSELGKLSEAEALYRKCLELDANDSFAKNELQYIAGRRKNGT